MNQILDTKLKNKKKINKIFLKFQFTFSLLVAIILIGLIIYYVFSLYKKEKLSNQFINNYNIYKLYATDSNETNDDDKDENNLFGIIEIPKSNIYYPVFSHLNEELLKVSPCKFYGTSPKEDGNICIAGHNYNNSLFFSNLSLLSADDKVYLYDNTGYKYTYTVFKIYEVNKSDLSPIFDYNQYSKELTLVTCNNLNSNRFIVKAKQT